MMKSALALSLLAAAPAVLAQTTPMPVQKIDGTVLEISAEGESKRTPDLATVSAGVVTQSPVAATAMRDNAARIERVIAALKRAGVLDRDIQTSNISLQPQYRYAQNQPPVITGYQAQNTVSVRFRDLDRAGAVLDALVATGANQINGPDLSLDNPSAAMDEARLDAMTKARARADIYARAAGLRVKRILSISESGPVMPPRPMPVMMRAQAMEQADTKIMAGEQALSINLQVRFELE